MKLQSNVGQRSYSGSQRSCGLILAIRGIEDNSRISARSANSAETVPHWDAAALDDLQTPAVVDDHLAAVALLGRQPHSGQPRVLSPASLVESELARRT